MTRGVQHFEAELRALDRVAFADDAIGNDRRVLVDALAVREHFRARGLHQPCGSGPMIRMGVGQDDPADALAHRGAHDGVDVALIVGPGIDDGDLVDPHQIGVGTGAGERPGVGRHDPANQGRQRTRDTGGEVGHLNPFSGGRTSATPTLAPTYCRWPSDGFGAWLYAAGAMPIDPRRAIPAVERVVARLGGLPQPLLADCAREAIDAARVLVAAGEAVTFDGIVADAEARVARRRATQLRRVVNATGVLLHTNLGRAPLGIEAIRDAIDVAGDTRTWSSGWTRVTAALVTITPDRSWHVRRARRPRSS